MNKDDLNSGITVGDVSDSIGIAIGHHARAYVHQVPTVNVSQIVELIDDLTALINSRAAALADPEEARQIALEARTESMNEAPRWKRVGGLLTNLRLTVAGVASLTAIVDNIRTLIPH
jgi:hypothetical protein